MFGEGEPLQEVLACARHHSGPGHFIDSQGLVVTERSTLEEGSCVYLPASAGDLSSSAAEKQRPPKAVVCSHTEKVWSLRLAVFQPRLGL